MPEEATLDAFVSDDAENSDAENSDAEADAATESDETAKNSDAEAATAATAAGDVEPAPVTSSWTADGVACSACGEPAARLWERGDGRVCATCKPWTANDPCDQ